MSSRGEFRVVTALESPEGMAGFVTMSSQNAAYTRFLLGLKATGRLAGQAEYFIALDGDGERVGRMAAILGPNPDAGLVGLFALTEKRSDEAWGRGATRALLSSCERWLLSRGIDKVYGARRLLDLLRVPPPGPDRGRGPGSGFLLGAHTTTKLPPGFRSRRLRSGRTLPLRVLRDEQGIPSENRGEDEGARLAKGH
jgi:hypothetical protein